jgi:uncharacterized membrane protein YozB (DUF420 family)
MSTSFTLVIITYFIYDKHNLCYNTFAKDGMWHEIYKNIFFIHIITCISRV